VLYICVLVYMIVHFFVILYIVRRLFCYGFVYYKMT